MRKAALAVLVVVAVAAGVMMLRSRFSRENSGEAPARQTRTASPPPFTGARLPAFSTAFVERLGGLLREAGVDVLPDEMVFERGEAGGPGFAVSEFQLRTMAVEIAGDAGGGFYGSHLDEIAPLPNGVPPLSFFIAGWMHLGQSPAARSAAALMGPRDWTTAPDIIFPTVVLAGFVGDAVRASSQPRTQQAQLQRFYRSLGRVRLMTAGLMAVQNTDSGPCAFIGNFVNSLLANIADALKIDTDDDGFFGFVAGIYNAVVEFAATVIKGLIETLTAPIVAALKTAVAVVGVVSTVGSMLRPWSVRVTPSPNPNRYAIDKEPAPAGSVAASINDNGFPGWPSTLVSCAKLVGIELPSTDADVGSPVQWISVGGAKPILNRVYRDDVLPATKVARLDYTVVGRETAQDAQQGRELNDTVTIQVRMERRAMTKLRDLITSMIFGTLPGVVSTVARPLLEPYTDAVLTKLTALVAANGSTVLTIRHHTLVRCLLFTRAEASAALRQQFTIIAPIPPTGCSAGIPDGGPNVGYYYSAAPCELARQAVVLTGINPLNLGRASFDTQVGGRHRVAFPALSAPANCVMLDAGPISAISGGALVRFAGTIRPRS